MSDGLTPAIRNAAPPIALFAAWSAAVRPIATGSPVVPDVTWIRTRRSRGAHSRAPNGGCAAWSARSSAFVVSGSAGRSAAERTASARPPIRSR